MYKSSGTNSGMPNTWLPFDEVFEQNYLIWAKGWKNKQNYTNGTGIDRFGTEELRSISQQLTAANVQESNAILEDEFHANTILDFFGARIRENMAFRPTGDKPKDILP